MVGIYRNVLHSLAKDLGLQPRHLSSKDMVLFCFFLMWKEVQLQFVLALLQQYFAWQPMLEFGMKIVGICFPIIGCQLQDVKSIPLPLEVMAKNKCRKTDFLHNFLCYKQAGDWHSAYSITSPGVPKRSLTLKAVYHIQNSVKNIYI